MARAAESPMAVFSKPVVLEVREQLPAAVFLYPVVLEHMDETPTATLLRLEPGVSIALHPRATLPHIVQPRILPAEVGVASGIMGVAH